jgi:hypothetical protein
MAMIKRLLVLAVLSALIGVPGSFAQSGNQPKLAASGDNKPTEQGAAHVSSAQPVLSATAANGNANKGKQVNNVKPKVAPKLAATGDNNSVQK